MMLCLRASSSRRSVSGCSHWMVCALLLLRSLTMIRMLISRCPYIERCSHKTGRRQSARLVHSVLYVPQISNLDSGDCFYLVPLPTSGYSLVVLQFIMGISHPVKANGLHDILFAYSQDVRVQVVSKALVFVLPARSELQQKGKQMEDSSSVPVAVRDFKQYMYRHRI